MARISRRDFVGGAGRAALGAGALATLVQSAGADPLGLPIGLQLYTVQDRIQADFDGTIRQVAAIGYRAVETNLTLAGRGPRELRLSFESLGLDWKSAHVGGAELQGDLQKTIDQARDAGLDYLVCAFPIVLRPERFQPPAKDLGGFVMDVAHGFTLDDWKANADLFNKIGEQSWKAGIQFAYHNHNIEFRKFGATTGYEELLRRTDPRLVKLELDCGWMVSAGQDPVEYLARYPGRYVMLHIKDLKPGTPPNTELKMQGTEIGSGIIDWPRLFAAAKKAAIAGYYVEQEPPFARSSLESVRIDFEYLHRLAAA